MSTPTKKLEFGLQPSEGAKLAWGARLIWNGTDEPDLVFDRQSFYAAEDIGEEAKTQLCELADGTIKVEWRTSELKKLRIMPNNATVAEGEMKHWNDTYKWRASANASYGYLYVVIERIEKE